MSELDVNVNTPTENENAENPENNEPVSESAEIARLKAELLKAKAATDKATKEAAENKRLLRAKQSAEEIAAETQKEQQAALERELNELRKERAVANASKRVMTFIQDETTATSIAESLYGAADVDAAIDALQKAWTAKEKAIRSEFGKVPAPGVGSPDGPTITKAELDSMGYRERLEFAQKHQEEYKKLTGR